MTVYLAAAFCRKEEILEVAHQLEELGITVTSRWLVEQEFDPTRRDKAEFLATRARIDLDDIDRATDKAQSQMDSAIKTMEQLTGSKNSCQLCTIIILVVIFVVGACK